MAEGFEGETVLITGAGRREGLGFALAAALAGQGARVVLTARRAEAAEALAAEIPGARGLGLDVTDDTQIAAVAHTLGDRLDVLINNAAATSAWGETVAGADLGAARAGMDATLFGAWRMTQALLPLLRAAPRGRIVNVSSGAGSHGDPAFGLTSPNAMGPAYAVAKAALNALTAATAREEASLRVNAVCPGFTATFEGGAEMGARPVEESVPGVLWAAALPADGPTGGFFRDRQPLPW